MVRPPLLIPASTIAVGWVGDHWRRGQTCAGILAHASKHTSGKAYIFRDL